MATRFHQGPLITFNFEGQVITSYMDAPHYSYDDLYGYSLGFLQGQGLDAELMKNASGWIAISRLEVLGNPDQVQLPK